MAEEIKEALNIYIAQTGIINTLWNIYMVVALAMIGYVYKDRTLMDDWKIKLGLSIGFPLFAVVNNDVMVRSQEILLAATNYLNAASTGDTAFEKVLDSHKAYTVEKINLAHLIFTILTILTMWLPNIAKALFSRKNKSDVRKEA